MKLFCLSALLVAASQAIAIQKQLEASLEQPIQQLSQTQTDAYADADLESTPNCCECDCPGVLQLPGACKSIINRNDPLCYCNNGMYHVDWDHNISVDNKKACANCGIIDETEPPFSKDQFFQRANATPPSDFEEEP